MKMIYKILLLALLAFFSVFFIKNTQLSTNKKTVGIIQFMEHPALDEARKGFVSKLAELGYVNKNNINIWYESAQGSPALSSQIAQKFVGQDVDLIIAIGTAPAQSALQNIMRVKDKKVIPMIFLSITDPEDASLIKRDAFGKFSSEYASGISDYVEPAKQLKMFKKMLPEILNLGVIYNPGESNSATILMDLKETAKDFSINIVVVPATKTSEVIMAVQNIKDKVDAIFIDNDNTALAAFDSISDMCIKYKIPLFVSDVDLADKALASLGPDQRKIGGQGAQFAALLLAGKSLSQDLGVQYPANIDLYLNNGFAKKIDFKIPESLNKKAHKVLE